MTLSLVPFPPLSRSLARFITSARWSLPLPGDRELYLIPVVILAKFGPFPPPLTSLKGELHLPAGWSGGIDSGALWRWSPKNACVGASRGFASAGRVPGYLDQLGSSANMEMKAEIMRLRSGRITPFSPGHLNDAPPLSSAALVRQVSAAKLAKTSTHVSGQDFQNKPRQKSFSALFWNSHPVTALIFNMITLFASIHEIRLNITIWENNS